MPSVTLRGCSSFVLRHDPAGGEYASAGICELPDNAPALLAPESSTGAEPPTGAADSNNSAYAIRRSPPPTSRISASTGSTGSRIPETSVINANSGTKTTARRKIKRPFLIPLERADIPPAGRSGRGSRPPVSSSSAAPVSRKPQREQKLVSVECLSWPHCGQNIRLLVVAIEKASGAFGDARRLQIVSIAP